MTPKEKAKELVDKLLESLYDNGSLSFKRILYHKAKQCALIAVEEILNEYQSMSDLESILVINNKPTFVVHQLVYWMEVKQNIQKL